ncbi:polysaccharide biosynthesis protein [Sinimarinibacterium thermocellulolyticum]|uniref:UDP-glucose 4-epimerase n=1 Tax=Sinimarinibacterium thermocellulolyticum TaxID=3170016 RepID=A0ABV2A5U3_9GAMM
MKVIVTGGTGSFGRKMVNKLLTRSDVSEIRVFSRDEWKQDQMRNEIKDDRVRYYVGDVRDRLSVDGAMRGVDFLFHAAALKQVPSCEFFPHEAVQTNVLGSRNVALSAIAHGVKRAVFLSTDKAVQPVNAMGMSKALMEKSVQAESRRLGDGDTVLATVRYGNVMYSRGSVIPLFVDQIARGQPLTLTVPEMTRFLLSLEHAIELVDFALQNARQGDLFVRKAPACTVGDLAQAVLELFESDVGTKIIGIRHGEKLYETLASREELGRSEDMGDYYRISMDDRDLNYEKYFSEGDRDEAARDDYHSHNTQRLDVAGVKKLLLTLPEIHQALAARRR